MELTGNMFQSFQSFLTPSFLEKTSSMLGLPADKIKTAVTTAIPLIMDKVKQKASTPDGFKSFTNLIHDGGFDQPARSDQQSMDTQFSKGRDFLDRIFGNNVGELTDKVASAAGVNSTSANKLLGVASASVFTFFGTKMAAGQLNPSFFSKWFGSSTSPTGSMPGMASSPISTGSSRLWTWLAIGAAAIGIILWGANRRVSIPTVSVPSASDTVAKVTDTVNSTVAGAARTVQMAISSSSVKELSNFLATPAADGVLPKSFSFGDLRFETASVALNAEGQKTLNELSDLLMAYPETRIRIEGHTDNVGNVVANQRLSALRADALRKGLMAKGISADRLEAVGYGDTKPVADNSTAEGRMQNRRTDVVVIKQ